MTPTPRILVVDDEPNVRRTLQLALENGGLVASVAPDALRALELLRTAPFDCLVVDIQLPEIDGLQLFRRVREEGLELPVIVISGNGTLREAADAVRAGAFEFLEKPLDAERLRHTVGRALEHAELRRRVECLSVHEDRNDFVGGSRTVAKLLAQVDKVAATDATVLIRGESGTGKELIARRLHERSQRRGRAFVRVNCSAIPETLLESELFGHERGAFTGALTARRGHFEAANGGTIFLDEIGDMSLAAQAKVLRALQNGEIQKVGSERVLPVDVRVIAATHKNLEAEAKAGRFREDLFYRVNVVPFYIPALRERPEDIPLLAETFRRRFFQRNGLREKVLTGAVMQALCRYAWPGNVRELENLIERLLILAGDRVEESDLPPFVTEELPRAEAGAPLTLHAFKERTERQFVVAALRRTGGNVSRAAKELGIKRTYLHRKIRDFGIEKREYF